MFIPWEEGNTALNQPDQIGEVFKMFKRAVFCFFTRKSVSDIYKYMHQALFFWKSWYHFLGPLLY